MCGIFAYLNFDVPRERRFILELLFNGLRRLEYRGYDSSGISIDSDHRPPTSKSLSLRTPPPLVFREEGKIEKLVTNVYQEAYQSELDLELCFSNHAGIAHTRWATHGLPSPRNSHPQSSGAGNDFLVVHNGIITNYMVLKETLLRHGFEFESETDTEVIPKLAKFVHDRLSEGKHLGLVSHLMRPLFNFFAEAADVSFTQVVMEVMRQLEGAYALIFKSPHYPNELVSCKRGSPLLLGVKDTGEEYAKADAFEADLTTANGIKKPKEIFLASDAAAVVEHTKRVMVIEDNEVVHIKDGNISIFKFDSDKARKPGGLSRPASVQRALSLLELEVEQIKKGNYEHYMEKEIFEQPESLTTTMRGRLIRGGESKLKSVVLGGLKDHLRTMRRSRRIIFIGCGTSYNAALAARPIIEELSGVPVTMELASDLLDRQGPIYREDTAVFVSQSGETADTLQALEYANSHGALCVGITNTVGSAIARGTHCGVHINAGCEIGVASTKAYTSQIAVMTMLALALGDDSMSSRNRREEIVDGLFDLPNKVKEVLKLDKDMKELAKLLTEEQSLLIFGRGYNYATALEGALKVKEVALMHSEGILAGEMKHGPLALVDETLPIIVIATRDATFSKQQSVIQQLRARKGRLIVICTKGDAEAVCPYGVSRVIEVPRVEDCLQPVINIVPLQLLAYHLTVLRGYNVDQPRNLAKSVTTQ
ncbi:glutamine--fructose-6-phosphate aminotransferase [isomerizing] 2 isoform X1 [Selaginella moellendorffii]|uniref:glutamine--fructose-6-phosphate aminotransferase [isomerizing] 2 isoform X1 n=1 Tax=Selaginella moellendorffii TaxID=88036 RepID=UPI000D1C92BA|nr:glutamine--fructose-6-phosphate aminotransferase [isomerizing] 2 isoform X1 [Selaginella moellendorffii]|eukprot:XP_024516322.1 glutamine--fructose-6-phosphate aminotransferase [isomerizing] 2 isoform X1 [Selaginella moellendorffii]